MSTNQSDKIKHYQFFKKLTLTPMIEKIILYGSRARNDSNERSDIDLAIFCPHADEKTWLQILDLIEQSDTLLKIDCVRYDRLNPDNPLRTSIDNEGIILFDRNQTDDP